jgi:hypothetical protein
MKKLLICLVPVALIAAQASATPSSGWAGLVAGDLGAATDASDDANIVLVQRRGGGGAHVNRANMNRASVNRSSFNRSSFNSSNFHRDVSVDRNVNVNRNVSVNRGSYGPNWGGVAAGVAVGAGVTAMATSAAAASSAYYPPPPYPYYPNSYGY